MLVACSALKYRGRAPSFTIRTKLMLFQWSREGEVLRAQVVGAKDVVEALLTAIPGVVDVQYEDSGAGDAYLVTSAPGQDVRDPLAKAVVDGGFGLRELRTMDMTLEDVFLQLTNEDSAEA